MTAKKSKRSPRTLLIDNYDSYTYNLFQMLWIINGIKPIVVKNDSFDSKWSTAWTYLSKNYNDTIDNIVISPGPGDPTKSKDFGMCKEAILTSEMPILGVCLGHQGLIEAYGGCITPAPEPIHGQISLITCDSNEEIFKYIPRTFNAVRYHSLIGTHDNSSNHILKTIATLTDNSDIIMAIKHKNKNQFGVQYHPESICTEFGFQLLLNFNNITMNYPHELYDMKNYIFEKLTIEKPISIIDYTEINNFSQEKPYKLLIKKISMKNIDSNNIFTLLYGSKDKKSIYWLDSSLIRKIKNNSSNNGGKFSFMGDDEGPLSFKILYFSETNELHVINRYSNETFYNKNLMIFQEEIVKKFKNKYTFQLLDHEMESNNGSTLPFDFHGGFIGYYGYELLLKNQNCAEKKENNTKKINKIPSASFLFSDRYIAIDHINNNIYIATLTDKQGFEENKKFIQQIETKLKEMINQNIITKKQEKNSILNEIKLLPSLSYEEYIHNIKQIKEKIYYGETYEVCLTNQLMTEYKIKDSIEFYSILRKINPAPYACYYRIKMNNENEIKENIYINGNNNNSNNNMNQNEITICCSSPERFLHVNENQWIESKPIKGTRKRGCTEEEDIIIYNDLSQSVKDKAENLMIVDLVRNDLSQVCQIGSVSVPKLMKIETYAHVHQLVSTIIGLKRDDKTLEDLIKATFPGGSMTGAPKKRTMEIIMELEKYPRGIYSGAFGYLSINQSLSLNIIIRTAVLTNAGITIGTGGAIIYLSDPEEEYQEMLLKAKPILKALKEYTGKEIEIIKD